MREEREDLMEVLLDGDDKEPIQLQDVNGNIISFEQVATIPWEVRREKRIYCVLKPLDKIEGIDDDEAIVFRVDVDENGDTMVRLEEDMEIASEVFEKYYQLLEKRD